MYHTHKKAKATLGAKILPADCFVEKTKNWVWTVIVLIVGATVYAVVTSSGQNSAHSATGRPFPQGGQFQNIALLRCPYCPGFLDAQGRCNVRECPIYSPDWGKLPNRAKPSNWQGIPARQVLIKELALEVSASEGKTSVVIHSVYDGGNAEKAGLQMGDRILRFNGRKVKSVKQFKSIVARAKPESKIKIQVVRNSRRIKSVVMTGEGEMEGVTVPKTRG